jgi:ribosomal protein S18 acetylase RimI-like enzyme
MPGRLRPPTPADAEAVLTVILARDVADIGEPDFELADVHADWATPGLNLADDARVWEDDDGALAGYAILLGNDAVVLTHPGAEGRGIGTALREWAEARAAERGTARLRQFTSGPGARAHLEPAGYEVAQRYYRMRAQLDGAAADGHAPGIRAFDPDRDAEAVHAVVQEAFADIEGSVAQTFPEWRAKRMEKDGYDPSLWRVAEDDDGIAGVSVNERWADAGYVDQLAVARRARRRGLGRALLLASFDGFRVAGLPAAVLSVHGRNDSAAALYRSVGMESVWEAQRFEKELVGG